MAERAELVEAVLPVLAGRAKATYTFTEARLAVDVADAVLEVVTQVEARTLKVAADEVRREARRQQELAVTGRPPDPVDRLLLVERILRERARQLEE